MIKRGDSMNNTGDDIHKKKGWETIDERLGMVTLW